MDEAEKEITEFLIKNFELLLRSDKENQRIIAMKINRRAEKLIQMRTDVNLDPSLREILYGCLDLHHWGDANLPPYFDRKKIVLSLRTLERLRMRRSKRDQR